MRRLNRRLRRHLRDVDGGLLFSWRVPGGSFRRTSVGVLVATALFAGAGSLVHVRIPLDPGEIRESAQLLVLDPDDPDARSLLDWARLHSPFPSRWEPGGSGTLESLMARVDVELDEKARYQPLLQRTFFAEATQPLPGLIGAEIAGLPRPEVELSPSEERLVAAGVVASSQAGGALAPSWGARTVNWEGDDAVPFLGQEARFLVGVDPDGRVGFCLVMEDMGEELTPRLERWIRSQSVEPDPDRNERVWDIVRVRLEAVGGTREGVAP